MDTAARLITTRSPRNAEGLVLVLHGGASRRDVPEVSPTQLSVLRMVPIARRLARAGRGRLAVVRVLNSVRGWDTRHTPVEDVRWALDQLRERYDGLPTCLVGHSLGGRAALLAGDQPEVRSVVALNPWVHPSDRVDLAGRPVLVVHGTEDRVADPRRSAAMAQALARTTHVGYLRVSGGRHAMLRHRTVFEDAAADFATATLLGDAVTGPVGALLDGEREVTV
jgi:pimeloyl-ACP methyl ester carboxylesterase